MRNKILSIILLIIAISLLTIGIAQGQHNIIKILYDKMAGIP